MSLDKINKFVYWHKILEKHEIDLAHPIYLDDNISTIKQKIFQSLLKEEVNSVNDLYLFAVKETNFNAEAFYIEATNNGKKELTTADVDEYNKKHGCLITCKTKTTSSSVVYLDDILTQDKLDLQIALASSSPSIINPLAIAPTDNMQPTTVADKQPTVADTLLFNFCSNTETIKSLNVVLKNDVNEEYHPLYYPEKDKIRTSSYNATEDDNVREAYAEQQQTQNFNEILTSCEFVLKPALPMMVLPLKILFKNLTTNKQIDLSYINYNQFYKSKSKSKKKNRNTSHRLLFHDQSIANINNYLKKKNEYADDYLTLFYDTFICKIYIDGRIFVQYDNSDSKKPRINLQDLTKLLVNQLNVVLTEINIILDALNLSKLNLFKSFNTTELTDLNLTYNTQIDLNGEQKLNFITHEKKQLEGIFNFDQKKKTFCFKRCGDEQCKNFKMDLVDSKLKVVASNLNNLLFLQTLPIYLNKYLSTLQKSTASATASATATASAKTKEKSPSSSTTTSPTSSPTTSPTSSPTTSPKSVESTSSEETFVFSRKRKTFEGGSLLTKAQIATLPEDIKSLLHEADERNVTQQLVDLLVQVKKDFPNATLTRLKQVIADFKKKIPETKFSRKMFNNKFTDINPDWKGVAKLGNFDQLKVPVVITKNDYVELAPNNSIINDTYVDKKILKDNLGNCYICPEYWSIKYSLPLTSEQVNTGVYGKVIKSQVECSKKCDATYNDDENIFQFADYKGKKLGQDFNDQRFVGLNKHQVPNCYKNPVAKNDGVPFTVVEEKKVKGKETPSSFSPTTVVQKDKTQAYVLASMPLKNNQLGYLPEALQTFLNISKSSISNVNIFSILRHGVIDASFLGCLLYYYNMKIKPNDDADKILTLQAFLTDILLKKITEPIFKKLQNGALVDVFGDYESFKKYLSTDKVDYTYLWDFVCQKDLLFKNGVNLVMVEIINLDTPTTDDHNDNIRILCPSNYYSLYKNEETIIILKYRDYFEPIIVHLQAQHDVAFFKDTVVENEVTYLELTEFLRNIKKNLQEGKCTPVQINPLYKGEKVKTIDNLLDEVRNEKDGAKRFQVVKGSNGKYIGLYFPDDKKYLPCMPSMTFKNIKDVIDVRELDVRESDVREIDARIFAADVADAAADAADDADADAVALHKMQDNDETYDNFRNTIKKILNSFTKNSVEIKKEIKAIISKGTKSYIENLQKVKDLLQKLYDGRKHASYGRLADEILRNTRIASFLLNRTASYASVKLLQGNKKDDEIIFDTTRKDLTKYLKKLGVTTVDNADEKYKYKAHLLDSPDTEKDIIASSSIASSNSSSVDKDTAHEMVSLVPMALKLPMVKLPMVKLPMVKLPNKIKLVSANEI